MKIKHSGVGAFFKLWCARRGMVLANYTAGDRLARLRDFVELRSSGRLLQNPADACQLVSALRATKYVAGDIAEVGTAAGGSARLIGQYSSGKTIHVFDTFEGLPKPGPIDVMFHEGQYKSDIAAVQNYLKGLPVEFHKGLFPASAASVQNRAFSFVHLDVDLYRSVTDCLEFFYPRLTPGGILVCHDYLLADGVTKAIEDFFSGRPESPIELIGYQAMIVKVGHTAPSPA